MHIRKYIKKIVDDGSPQKMEELADILEEVIEDMQEFNEDEFERYEMKLYKMAYGEHLTRELAEEIVENMRPFGEKWSFEETDRIRQDARMDNIDPVDFYIVINQGINDYKGLFGDDLNNYIKYVDMFIHDPDAKPNKVFRYFVIVPE